MVHALIVGCGLLAAAPVDDSSPSAEDLSVYQTARAEARRDPDAHVRLALWCEAHGMPAERLRHLAVAVLADPSHATARGLLGLVAFAEGWRKPAEVEGRVRADADLAARFAEYNGKRAGASNTADGQWDLAHWCESRGLDAEATAHFTAVTRLDPGREAAWKRLGYKKHDGRWMTDAQLAAQKAETGAQKAADRRWTAALEKCKAALSRPDKRAGAEATLTGIIDPRAVPAIWRVLASGGASDQAHAAQVLGQIDGPTASKALATLAIRGKSAEVRRAAGETLVRRDPREFVGFLIGLLRKPMTYEAKPVGGPGDPGILLIEDEQAKLRRVYEVPALPTISRQRIAQRESGVIAPLNVREALMLRGPIAPMPQALPFDFGGSGALEQALAQPGGAPAFGGGVEMGMLGSPTGSALNPVQGPAPASSGLARLQVQRDQIIARDLSEAQKSTQSAQQRLQDDIASVEGYNADARQVNASALQILSTFSDRDLGEDRAAWISWWTEERGYSAIRTSQQTTTKPTFNQVVPAPYTPSYVPKDCFGAGTPALTLDGPRPIESIRVGDRVLSQDSTTGALSYQPVVAVSHDSPEPTLRVRLGGDSIIATGIHRFWKSGHGWVMARDLRPGDQVRTLGGLAEVEAVEPDAVQPVFNLEVAEGRSFFAGRLAALVHDKTLVEPVLDPFDAPPSLARAEVVGR